MSTDMCHNGHPFEPGVDVDMAAESRSPDVRWCNVCGDTRGGLVGPSYDRKVKMLIAQRNAAVKQGDAAREKWMAALDLNTANRDHAERLRGEVARLQSERDAPTRCTELIRGMLQCTETAGHEGKHIHTAIVTFGHEHVYACQDCGEIGASLETVDSLRAEVTAAKADRAALRQYDPTAAEIAGWIDRSNWRSIYPDIPPPEHMIKSATDSLRAAAFLRAADTRAELGRQQQ